MLQYDQQITQILYRNFSSTHDVGHTFYTKEITSFDTILTYLIN